MLGGLGACPPGKCEINWLDISGYINTPTPLIQPTKWASKTRETRNDLKYAILKKGIGIESEKLCIQVRDQIVWKYVENTAQGLL